MLCFAISMGCQSHGWSNTHTEENAGLSGETQSASKAQPECPPRQTICPMIHRPVVCTITFGNGVSQSFRASNECLGQQLLMTYWCATPERQAQKAKLSCTNEE